jgi:hypothetical protein
MTNFIKYSHLFNTGIFFMPQDRLYNVTILGICFTKLPNAIVRVGFEKRVRDWFKG